MLSYSFPGPHGHWLDVCIALQQSVALFLLVLPLVSARVLAPHDEKNGYVLYICMYKCVCMKSTMVCMHVRSAGKHPAVENMGKLCRRMLRMRKERSSQLSGQVRVTSPACSLNACFFLFNRLRTLLSNFPCSGLGWVKCSRAAGQVASEVAS